MTPLLTEHGMPNRLAGPPPRLKRPKASPPPRRTRPRCTPCQPPLLPPRRPHRPPSTLVRQGGTFAATHGNVMPMARSMSLACSCACLERFVAARQTLHPLLPVKRSGNPGPISPPPCRRVHRSAGAAADGARPLPRPSRLQRAALLPAPRLPARQGLPGRQLRRVQRGLR